MGVNPRLCYITHPTIVKLARIAIPAQAGIHPLYKTGLKSKN